mgnify:CR=1 FL=1
MCIRKKVFGKNTLDMFLPNDSPRTSDYHSHDEIGVNNSIPTTKNSDIDSDSESESESTDVPLYIHIEGTNGEVLDHDIEMGSPNRSNEKNKKGRFGAPFTLISARSAYGFLGTSS